MIIATNQQHWTDDYRDAAPGTREYWIYRVACYTSRYSEEQVRAIADICFFQGVCVWHACSIYQNSLENCMCSPCQKARTN